MKNPSDVRLSYQENAVCGATPIQLVVILYDVAIDDIGRALTAMRAGNLEGRGEAMRHALLVLQQLQGTLDFEKGGQAAKQFEQFYNLIRGKLLEAQMRNSCELMQQQLQFMAEVRSCWIKADLQLRPPQRSSAPVAVLAAEATEEREREANEWSA